MKLLPKDNFTDLMDALSQQAVVYVPKEVEGVLKFAPYSTPDPLRLDATNTLLPPKDMLFPQCQKMYHYGIDNNNEMFIDPIIESCDQILFGARPCDIRSLECLDEVFLTKGFIDEYYQEKRDKLLTVAIGCTQPAKTCFCESMGLNPNEAPSADIMLHEAENAYTVEAQTPKGEHALNAWEPFLTEGEVETAEVHCTLNVDSTNIKKNSTS